MYYIKKNEDVLINFVLSRPGHHYSHDTPTKIILVRGFVHLLPLLVLLP